MFTEDESYHEPCYKNGHGNQSSSRVEIEAHSIFTDHNGQDLDNVDTPCPEFSETANLGQTKRSEEQFLVSCNDSPLAELPQQVSEMTLQVADLNKVTNLSKVANLLKACENEPKQDTIPVDSSKYRISRMDDIYSIDNYTARSKSRETVYVQNDSKQEIYNRLDNIL